MYSAKVIQEMTDREVRTALDTLATRYYGTSRWRSGFAAECGVGRSSVFRWMDDQRPPAWTLLLLQAWLERDDAMRHLNAVKNALGFAAKIQPSSPQ